MATLADVARRAGVSTATASRIINGSPKPVTEELRARVLAAVAELRYVPNAHAQMLARSNRNAVGVLVHDVSDPYFAEITRGLQQVATAGGRLTIICNTFREPARELEYIDLLHAHQVAAIVVAGSGYLSSDAEQELDARMTAFEATGGRIAVIGRHHHACDAVLPANEEGGYLAGSHLFELGHTSVGVIAGPAALTTTADRLAGLQRAATSHGRTLTVTHADFTRDGGEAAAAALLASDPTITAIAALNDSMAVGALAAMRTAGRFLSVIGFDDMPIARDVTPALTSIRLPLTDLGKRAMELALDPPPPNTAPRVEKIPAELIRRDSTWPVSQSR
ncbi:LacI family DNA-binding transcriptional regulator [Paractinoplanes brasiliensis]|uniref:LacI family transcriptional regulator n=1 Tax=Paractinoplanes brasiliensis TaxID=52695 RepID=A0A4R6K3G7_9ACTN|nr:LacI family DNA-binding transcriptional regulator [Actinoplanes brasiliensis]TDO42236.1 LacI family transcriptional regulator [Actinoplanes brasiliensis]GID29465.1 LacI family transcriptional regulator [Actinoplanes brasiliensis]